MKAGWQGKLIFTVIPILVIRCISVYPVRIEIPHRLDKITPRIPWQTQDQSVKVIKETVTLFLFSSPARHPANLHFLHSDCKKQNDVLILKFLEELDKSRTGMDKNKILEIQDESLDLLQRCRESYIQRNMQNILYLLTVYEFYR